ncbi:hypothetical protein DNK59_31405 [Pseudomonas sp. TKO26]|nr:hypothetical protein DNK62_31405 [Pseudomonas sp. TKO30]PYY78401.1 hypothetical protein DNK61_31395 [Pseudomonas sp. TKO29]PYY79950.1 hypothetical protein DNK59_31405 [Pseudomonas sp. TKO26]PYY95315.1 hypothetical protein DNK60_31395 [Pseudomonas sp. TKO14]
MPLPLPLLGLLIRLLRPPQHVLPLAMQVIADGEVDLPRRLTILIHDVSSILGTAFNRFVERILGSLR